MTLSLILMLLIPLFVVPVILLPQNKLKFYTVCAGIACAGVFVFYILDNLFFPDAQISANIGRIFLPVFNNIVNRDHFTLAEIYHLSYCLTLLCVYGLLYLLSFLIYKKFFIGKNPDIVKPSSVVRKVLDIVLFLCFTYIALALFLIEIRELLPLYDGHLGWLFDILHPIEA